MMIEEEKMMDDESMAPKGVKNLIVIVFLVVPVVSSVISMIHVYKFLLLGNPDVLAIVMSVTYELANLTTLVAVVVMKRLRQAYVWICFFVLVIIQVIGNVYYSFDYVHRKIAQEADWLVNLVRFMKQMIDLPQADLIFVLACVIGLPIPMVSLLLVKSTADYLSSMNQEDSKGSFDIEELPESEQPPRIDIVLDEPQPESQSPQINSKKVQRGIKIDA